MSAKPFRLTDEQIERLLRRRASPPSPALLGEILAAAEATPQRRTTPWGPIVIERRTLAILAAALLLAALAGAIAVGSGIVRPWPGPDAGYRNGEMVAVSGCRLVTIDPESGDPPELFGEPPGCTRTGPSAYPAGYWVGPVAWSADGSRSVFAVGCSGCAEAGQEMADDAGIWLLDAATREARQLVRCRRDDRDDRCLARLDISPDGSRVAFTGWSVGTDDYGLYVLNADGTDLSKIALDGWPNEPSFSPDGSLIAVAELLPGSDGAPRLGSLVVARTDGSGVRRLVERPNVEIRTPTWQPGGRRIAFSTWEYPPSTSTAIWTIDADGSNASELVSSERGESGAGFPGWSPDGSRIAYTVASTPTGPAAVEWWVMSADGSEQTLLHASTGPYYSDWTPARWSPDGRFIAFAVGQTDRDESGLFLIRPDGSDLRRVSESVVQLYWQPLR
jgi:Tol biopolymer transport system component